MIERVCLENFRSHERTEIGLGRLTIVAGRNASGKSSIRQAVEVALTGRCEVTDRAGRPGIAVAVTTDYWGAKQRFTLIFDPTTSALLSEERVLLERADWTDAKPPAVIGYTTYLESGVVTRLP